MQTPMPRDAILLKFMRIGIDANALERQGDARED